jgi:hypothetical protein
MLNNALASTSSVHDIEEGQQPGRQRPKDFPWRLGELGAFCDLRFDEWRGDVQATRASFVLGC